MKKNNYINKILFALCLSVIAIGCSDDDGGGSSVDFAGIASSLYEDDATTSVTVPLRNGSVSESEVILQGSATEGEDYTFDGVDGDGLRFTILEDDEWELNETIVVRIPSTGNSTHTITLVSNCEDLENLPVSFFGGDWNAIEWYCGVGVTTGGCDYGPYLAHLVQDETDPNRFNFDDFYDSGYDVYMIIDMEAGTVHFPNQDAVGDGSSPAIMASTGTYSIDLCTGVTTLTIALNYDGGDWNYTFTKL